MACTALAKLVASQLEQLFYTHMLQSGKCELVTTSLSALQQVDHVKFAHLEQVLANTTGCTG